MLRHFVHRGSAWAGHVNTGGGWGDVLDLGGGGGVWGRVLGLSPCANHAIARANPPDHRVKPQLKPGPTSLGGFRVEGGLGFRVGGCLGSGVLNSPRIFHSWYRRVPLRPAAWGLIESPRPLSR